ncbi:tRNA 2-selenouridine(34) synthase MnmH [Sagittula salina]|uniref:tRNA 2-selenouridine(34) synthase MnmH n=1 Tax=Sagittula salina TaxID=2820268 RepID=A0A940MKD9_9RHOB|nr:tRNA 2-selenouridine(34) synthase MnmH [Sagittula salina]MBP0481395.1 tRNA 2-selenouridine(34) synthase MnmH [Sagittula salina]
MTLTPKTLSEIFDHGFDTVIDVRSPAEFAEDHVPGAINLPVLDNEERAHVGTIYKQESPFKARKLGAALVFENAARHVSGPLAEHDGAWRPLVYCWRGGQRSGTFAWMLKEIGWRSDVVQGGYRTFRRLVKDYLYDRLLPFAMVQLGGYTGTAKTALLPLIAARGVQVLDLEALAHHRGSLLGGMPGGQPAQKAFETRLAQALHTFDPGRPVLVEAESSKIGELNLPPSVWEAMKAAPWLELEVPLGARARYLAAAYADILADPEALAAKLKPLRFHRGHDLVDEWCRLSAAGETEALCRTLAADHYDPAYRKAMQAIAPTILERFETPTLDDAALEALANRIAARLERVQTTRK